VARGAVARGSRRRGARRRVARARVRRAGGRSVGRAAGADAPVRAQPRGLGPEPDHGRRPDALLPPHRRTGHAASSRDRHEPAGLDRAGAAVGHRSGPRPAGSSTSRGAGGGVRAPSSTRSRSFAAATGAWRRPSSSPTARATPTPSARCAASSRDCSADSEAERPTGRRDRPGRRKVGAVALGLVDLRISPEPLAVRITPFEGSDTFRAALSSRANSAHGGARWVERRRSGTWSRQRVTASR
jgi:hypothetical protein